MSLHDWASLDDRVQRSLVLHESLALPTMCRTGRDKCPRQAQPDLRRVSLSLRPKCVLRVLTDCQNGLPNWMRTQKPFDLTLAFLENQFQQM